MLRFQSFIDNILIRDLSLKCNKHPYNLPHLKKIVITFKRRNNLVAFNPDTTKPEDDPLILAFFGLWHLTLQKPRLIKAKKSIAAFKIFKGDILGVQVTLRNIFMINFLDRFINQFLPSIAALKNFQGFPFKSHDRNFTIGLDQLTIFPEISEIFTPNAPSWGGKITFVFSHSDFNQNALFLTALQFPIFYENYYSFSKRS